MREREVLRHLDRLIVISEFSKDRVALTAAKKAIRKEYKFKFLCMLIVLAITVIIFGSFIAISYFMYR